MTRDALATTTVTEPMIQLWQGGNFTCDSPTLAANDTTIPPAACGYGATLGNMSALTDPFFAQLPSTFTSGLVRQFLPRFNSSSSFATISSSDYPANCPEAVLGYYSQYASNYSDALVNPWSVEVCMPASLQTTPWKNIHTRQDFTETLYLNISIADAGQAPTPGGDLYQITLSTTAGYFELPNYMNSESAGPLLDSDPNDFCDSMCLTQGIGFQWTDVL